MIVATTFQREIVARLKKLGNKRWQGGTMDNQTIKSILIHISQQPHPKSGIGWFINFKIDLALDT